MTGIYSNQFMRHSVTHDYHDSSLEPCPPSRSARHLFTGMGINSVLTVGGNPRVRMQKIPLSLSNL